MDESILNMLAGMDDDSNGGGGPLAALLPLLPSLLPGLLKTIVGDPEMMQEIISNTVGQYKPVIYAVLNEILVAYEDYAGNERIPNAHAKVKWNTYQAYIKAGFSEEQAMVFLVNADAASKGVLAQTARIVGSAVTT